MTDAELEAERAAILAEERSLLDATETLRETRMTERAMRLITNG